MEHPTRAPASHCAIILDRQFWYAAAQARRFLKARRYGPEEGSSSGPALIGPRKRGSGRGKGIRVAVAE